MMRRTRKRPKPAGTGSPAAVAVPPRADSRAENSAPASGGSDRNAPAGGAARHRSRLASHGAAAAGGNGQAAAGGKRTSPGATPSKQQMPSAPLRTLLSVAAILHLLAVGVSLLSVIEPSATQDRLLGFFRPYLQATHFGIDGRPLYLADGAPSENAFRLQFTETAEPTEADWRTIAPPGWAGLAASDRQHRWLATAVMLAESEQSSLAAELLLPVARQQDSAEIVRIERLPATLYVGASEGEPVPYTARVVRDGDQVALVQLQAPRLNAPATDVVSQGGSR